MDATPQISKNAGWATKYSLKKVLLSLFNSQNPSLVWVGRDLKIPLIPTSLGLSRADTGASLIHEILNFFPSGIALKPQFVVLERLHPDYPAELGTANPWNFK